jgi:hypothetical protein
MAVAGWVKNMQVMPMTIDIIMILHAALFLVFPIFKSLFNPQISPQRNRLRPDEIGFAFHWTSISQGRQITQTPMNYTDTNECAVEIAKSAGFNSRFSLAGLR